MDEMEFDYLLKIVIIGRSGFSRRLGGWQDQFAASLRQKHLQRRFEANDRSRFLPKNHTDRGFGGEGSVLGHGWTGKVRNLLSEVSVHY
jgi:hypothetical protein